MGGIGEAGRDSYIDSNINAYFDAHPDVTSYSLGVNDSSGYCECANCLAQLSGGKNFLSRTDYSNLYYDWANQVIEGVLKKHPDKWFGCLAYSEIAAPPSTVTIHPRFQLSPAFSLYGKTPLLPGLPVYRQSTGRRRGKNPAGHVQ